MINIPEEKIHLMIEILTDQKTARLGFDGKFWWCPMCNNRIYVRNGNHCPWCGQLIKREKK